MNSSGKDYYNACYCRSLRAAAAVVTKRYDHALKDAGLTSQQFSVLECLKGSDPVSVTALSHRLGLDRTSLSRNLKVLQRNGLVADTAGVGRSRGVVLSVRGLEALSEAERLWEQAQQDFEQPFTDAQLRELRLLLNRINGEGKK